MSSCERTVIGLTVPDGWDDTIDLTVPDGWDDTIDLTVPDGWDDTIDLTVPDGWDDTIDLTVPAGRDDTIDLTVPDVWDDTIDYYCTIGEDKQLLTRRKCGFLSCQQTTQLELCSEHLLDVGLEVKESRIPGSGWGLFTTRDRMKNELISYFTGVEIADAKFVGEYVSWRGGGVVIDSSIERCSAACANSRRGGQNCCIKTYDKKCYIMTMKPIRSGNEIYVAYGRSYRLK